MKAGDVPKFKMQGVEHGYWYRLPYCKMCDADMTIIYEPPCRGFEAEEGE